MVSILTIFLTIGLARRLEEGLVTGKFSFMATAYLILLLALIMGDIYHWVHTHNML